MDGIKKIIQQKKKRIINRFDIKKLNQIIRDKIKKI